jgi:hypothetical protein
MSENPKKDKPDKEEETEETEEETVEVKGSKSQRIKIAVSRDPEITALQAELAELKEKHGTDQATWEADKQKLEGEKVQITDELVEKRAIIQKKSMEDFEKEKQAILTIARSTKLTDAQMAEIETKLTTPANLEVVKTMVNLLSTVVQTVEKTPPKAPPEPPKGKATFIPPTDAEQFEDNVEMVNSLYDRAYYNPKKYTKEVVEDAKRKIDELIKSMTTGKSWGQLKLGGSLGKIQLMACPKCGNIIKGEVPQRCPKCNFNFQRTGDRE